MGPRKPLAPADYSTKPTTIEDYGFTDFNSLGDARWALIAHTHAFASLTGLTIGSGLVFENGILAVANNLIIQDMTPDNTIASATILDLTGLDGPLIQVTGTTDIDTIMLADGESRILIFDDALNLINGVDLALLGGVDKATAANSWGIFRGGPAGVVTMVSWQNDAGYQTATFDNIYMNSFGNISRSLAIGGYFDIARDDDPISLGNYIRFAPNDHVQLRNQLGALYPGGRVWLIRPFLQARKRLTFQITRGCCQWSITQNPSPTKSWAT